MQARGISFALPVFAYLAGSAATLAQSPVVIAPAAPPPPRVEAVPTPPTAQTQVMYWQPGRWMWSGANWDWAPGSYVQRPAPQAVWQPGYWAQQPSGGYTWVDGHWQG